MKTHAFPLGKDTPLKWTLLEKIKDIRCYYSGVQQQGPAALFVLIRSAVLSAFDEQRGSSEISTNRLINDWIVLAEDPPYVYQTFDVTSDQVNQIKMRLQHNMPHPIAGSSAEVELISRALQATMDEEAP